MIYLNKIGLSLIACLCLSCLNQAALSQTIWQGKSAGFNIDWTEKDFTVTKGSKIIFSAEKALAQKYFEREILHYPSGGPVCEYKRTLTLLSVVGNIVSLADTFEQHCQAFIHSIPKITTVDLANPEKTVSLTDFFAEPVILKALLANILIQKTLASKVTLPSTLDAFSQDLESAPNMMVEMENGENCQFQFSKDFLTQFAFHHVKKDHVAVYIVLSPAITDCRFEKVQLGIYLPIPKKLSLNIKKAQKSQAGFLMEKMKKKATVFYFSTDTYTPYPVAGTRVITVPKASLRTLPQVTNTNLIETLKEGTVIKTLARTSFQESNDYKRDYWYLAELKNGKIGWIFGALTKRLKKNPLMSLRKTTDDKTHVRSKQNIKARIVETLDKGVIVRAFARSKRQGKVKQVLDYWYKVKLASGKIGWIFGGKIMETETRLATSKKRIIRSAPKKNASIVEEDEQQTYFYIYGRSKHQDKIGGIRDYWYQVGDSRDRYMKMDLAPMGWVFGGDIMRLGAKITTTPKVRMRSAPHYTSRLIKKLDKGVVVVNAIARSREQDYILGNLDYWYKVKLANGQIGWVFGGLVMSIGFSEMPLMAEIAIQNVDNVDIDLETKTSEKINDEKAITTIKLNINAAHSYDAINKRLNDIYQQIISLLDSEKYQKKIPDTGIRLYPDGEEKQRLIEAQKGWLQFRENHCRFENFFFRGGREARIYEFICLETLTKQRITTLKKALKTLKK
jgi:uncharacterized protein YecT (DUF1311 family)/uncharacterized protein YgiM (DUF1202 family)